MALLATNAGRAPQPISVAFRPARLHFALGKNMHLPDYLIEHTGIDWQRLLANWRWLLSGAFTVWLINRFGDLFIILDSGSVHWLRLDDGTLTQVADSKDEFGRKLDEEDMGTEWLLIPLVDRLVAAGKVLKDQQCYAFVQPPILGGDYVVENVVPRDIGFQYEVMGPIYEKLRDLPNGTRVSFEITK